MSGELPTYEVEGKTSLDGNWIFQRDGSDPYDALLSELGVDWHPALLTRTQTPQYIIDFNESTFRAMHRDQPMYAEIPLNGTVCKVPSPVGGITEVKTQRF